MSAVRTRRNSTKPQIIKLDTEQSPAKNVGKPCVDFAPDDRWQLKEDDDQSSEDSTLKTKDINITSSKTKSTIVNGESTNHTSDSENCDISSSVKTEDDAKNEQTVSKAECNNESETEGSNSPKPNCHVKKKRKASDSEEKPNGKKTKSSKEDSHSEDNTFDGLSENDDFSDKTKPSEMINDAKVTLESVDIKKEPDEKISEDNAEVKKETSEKVPEDNIEIMKESSEKVPEDNIEIKKESSEKISEDNVEIKKESDEQISENTSKPDEKVAEDLCDKTEIKKSKDNSNDKDISIIEIDDDGPEKDSKVDSDNDDVQIIEGTPIKKKKEREPSKYEEKLSFSSLDNTATSLDVLLSAGYPYYNSIAEKVKDFKAGTYNPVKFPHMGTLFLSDTEVIIESPSLLVPLLIKEADQFPKLENDDTTEQDNKQNPLMRKNFFQSSVGQFLINLGASRVFEWYHRDMKRFATKQARKLPHPNKELESTIQYHDDKLLDAKETNIAFNFRMKKCQFCDFKTESLITMEGHYLIPHITPRREFKCNFCPFLTRDPKEVTFHYEAIHGKKSTLENQMVLHECLFCSFQSHLKSKVTVHMTRCKKNFIQSQNQSPPYDFEFPGVTTKPVSLADINGHRRMLLGNFKTQTGSFENFVQSALAKKRMSSVLNLTGVDQFQDNSALVKQLIGQQAKQGANSYQLPPGIVLTRPRVRGQQVRAVGPNLQPRSLPPLRPSGPVVYPNNIPAGISITPVLKTTDANKINSGVVSNLTLTPISSAGNQVVAKGGPPQPVALFTNVAGNDATRARMPGINPGKMPLTMTGRTGARMVAPYQRLTTPPSQVVKNSSGNTFVMCEICDSYIKDLEELRSHMNWVHKVKIHPKMLVSRPPLNCQKCQWRFFTDQGLERHLLGAHGLVTTNMQEMANNNMDGGRCIICGAVFTYKLVSHMTQVHKVTLKPAHLSYKCTVCTATFTLYRLFENHVYNVHSTSAKRAAEDSTSSSEPPAKKPNTEPSEEPPVKELTSRKCMDCGFITQFLEDHIRQKHMKDCSIKLCRIDKCKKCLYSTDEMLVIRLSDIESDAESEDSDSSEDESSSGDESKKSTSSIIVEE